MQRWHRALSIRPLSRVPMTNGASVRAYAMNRGSSKNRRTGPRRPSGHNGPLHQESRVKRRAIATSRTRDDSRHQRRWRFPRCHRCCHCPTPGPHLRCHGCSIASSATLTQWAIVGCSLRHGMSTGEFELVSFVTRLLVKGALRAAVEFCVRVDPCSILVHSRLSKMCKDLPRTLSEHCRREHHVLRLCAPKLNTLRGTAEGMLVSCSRRHAAIWHCAGAHVALPAPHLQGCAYAVLAANERSERSKWDYPC